jgi:ArsR family transcriptional regulator
MRTSVGEPIQVAEQQAEICQVFSNHKRILILWALAEKDMVVGEIAAVVGITVQNASHHLRIMKDRGILSAKRIGQHVAYGIESKECVEQLLNKAPVLQDLPDD